MFLVSKQLNWRLQDSVLLSLFGLPRTNPFASTPTDDLTTVNQRLVATLARQNLPKCHPEIFTGDVTLFHPWKSAFRAMIEDANVSPDQEINYLRSYTKGDAQKVINNYRQRQYSNPADALRDVWKELERCFGNTAAITNVLLVRRFATTPSAVEDLVARLFSLTFSVRIVLSSPVARTQS